MLRGNIHLYLILKIKNNPGKGEIFNDFKARVFAFTGNYFLKKAESEKKFMEE